MTDPWHLPIKESDASDFLGLNPQPGFTPPSLKRQVTTIPEADQLFQVQNNLLRTIQAMERLEENNKDLHWEGFDMHLRNSYKTLRRWLENHG